MLYQLECILNDKDYYEFNKYHMKNAADTTKSILFGKLLISIISLFILIYYIISGYDLSYILFEAIFFSIISIIWFFITEPLMLLFLKLHIKLMKKYSKIPYSNIATMQFYNDYFIETTKSTKTEIKYDAIHKVYINDKKAIYIYQNAAMAYIIPFSAFESNEKSEEFVTFIKEKTSSNCNLWKIKNRSQTPVQASFPEFNAPEACSPAGGLTAKFRINGYGLHLQAVSRIFIFSNQCALRYLSV